MQNGSAERITNPIAAANSAIADTSICSLALTVDSSTVWLSVESDVPVAKQVASIALEKKSVCEESIKYSKAVKAGLDQQPIQGIDIKIIATNSRAVRVDFKA